MIYFRKGESNLFHLHPYYEKIFLQFLTSIFCNLFIIPWRSIFFIHFDNQRDRSNYLTQISSNNGTRRKRLIFLDQYLYTRDQVRVKKHSDFYIKETSLGLLAMLSSESTLVLFWECSSIM